MTRYVLLRIEDDAQAATLVSDMACWPENDLLTPCQENMITATVVDLPGLDPRRQDVAREVTKSHQEYLAAPAIQAMEL